MIKITGAIHNSFQNNISISNNVTSYGPSKKNYFGYSLCLVVFVLSRCIISDQILLNQFLSFFHRVIERKKKMSGVQNYIELPSISLSTSSIDLLGNIGVPNHSSYYLSMSSLDGYEHMTDYRPRSMSEIYLPNVLQYENLGQRADPLRDMLVLWSKPQTYEIMKYPTTWHSPC